MSSTVERSRRVFGAIYSALPDELKAQSAHIAQGWAYGLWHWLETKFQSTEEDSVGELLGKWSSLRQEEAESFDSYRARVNKDHALLVHAKEKPSDRMYLHTLLDRLQPRYKAAVLALKTSDKLKDASKIDWDSVAAFINAHEREEARIDGEAAVVMAARGVGAGAGAWKKPPHWNNAKASQETAASAATRTSQSEKRRGGGAAGSGEPRRPRPDIKCFSCNKFGHFANHCPQNKDSKEQRPEGVSSEDRAYGVAGGEHRQDRREASEERKQQAKSILSRNRFDPLEGAAAENKYNNQQDSECHWNGAFAIKIVRPEPKKFAKKDSTSRAPKQAPGQEGAGAQPSAKKSAAAAAEPHGVDQAEACLLWLGEWTPWPHCM